MRTRAVCCAWSDVGSPGSRTTSFHTCQVLRPRRAVWTLAFTRPHVLPSAFATASAPGITIFTRLNGWPVRSPTDASPPPSRATAHGSRPMWLATPSSYRTCTDYSLPVSRRTAKDSGHYRSSASSQARKLLMASSICSPVRAFSSWWITRFRSARSRPSLCSFTYLTASSRRSCDASQGGADTALGLASHVEFATYHEVGSRRHRMPLNRDEPHIETVATIKLTHCRT